MPILSRTLAPLLALLLAFSLPGCASTSEEASAMHKLAGLTDLPLPRGYSLDAKETVVLGEADRWTGKIVYDINSNADDMLEYIRREMPGFGWQELSVFRANVSVLTFQRQGRVATVQIRRGRLYGSEVEMVVAPQTGASLQPAPGRVAPLAQPAGPQPFGAQPSGAAAPAAQAPAGGGNLLPSGLPAPAGPSRAVSVQPLN